VTLLGDGVGVELLSAPVDALSFEETGACAREPMTQRGVMVQVSQNAAKSVKIRSGEMLRGRRIFSAQSSSKYTRRVI
jgi:hypothetical protein